MDKPVSFEFVGLTPVVDLLDRYKLGRSVIYKRLKDLGIKPKKISVRTYVNAEQLKLLDSLHEFIQGGGTTAEFLFHRGQNLNGDT
ncbi:MAG: hypothetical protein ACFB0D_14570 [Phormidesmis sp.]